MPLTKNISKVILLGVIILFIFSIASTVTGQFPTNHPSEKKSIITKKQVLEIYSRRPLSFEANQGQTDSQVKFLSRGRGYSLFLTPTEAVLVLSKSDPTTSRHKADDIQRKVSDKNRKDFIDAVLRMKLIGANPSPQVNGLDELPGKINYFTGNDPKRWQTDIRSYAKVKYRDIYPGVNLVYYGNQNQLEYDFVISPGSDPKIIKISFEGARKLYIDSKGDLVLETAVGEIRQHKPHIYQEVNGLKQEIPGGYVLNRQHHQVSFQVAAYDMSKPLVIDPQLTYVSYLGGSAGDKAFGIALDPLGNNYYVTGTTSSLDFPKVAGASGFQPTNAGNGDVFVVKFRVSDNALLYSTYLGGGGEDQGSAIAVGSSGDAYVTGYTRSTDFPVFPIGRTDGSTNTGGTDVFITKFDVTGNLVYSRYLGGSADDDGWGIAVDSYGNAYVTGDTRSMDFPIPIFGIPLPPQPFQGANAGGIDAFVTKLNVSGNLIYSTYLGGVAEDRAYAIAVDSNGNAYVTGATYSRNFPITPGAYQTTFIGGLECWNGESWCIGPLPDVFVTKMDTTGSTLIFSTFLGGSGYDEGFSIAINSFGNAYITGHTNSPGTAPLNRRSNFPTRLPFQANNGGGSDAFVTKLTPSGSALFYSTYLGGINHDYSYAIAIDPSDNAYITGSTGSDNFPMVGTLANRPPPTLWGYFYMTKFNITGSVVFSQYFGSGMGRVAGGSYGESGNAIAVDLLGKAYVAGSTSANDLGTNFNESPFQAVYGGGDSDAFIAKWAEPPSGGTGGCLLKTALNESSDQRDLNTLRRFRDEALLTNSTGTLLVNAYYNASPYLSNLINEHEILRNAVRVALKPVVVLLNIFLDFPKEMESFLLFLPVMIGIIVVSWKFSRR